MHFRAITRIVGLLVILFSGTMFIPGLVALIYRDGAGRAFSQTFFVALTIGLMLWWPNRKQKHELKPREGFLIVVLFWTVLGSVGALPFLFSERPNLSLTDAFFESFSGLTTTGATTLVGLDSLPKAILFYRQMLQWMGGMGIIVLAVAILPILGVGGMQLYRAEMPGPLKDNLCVADRSLCAGALGSRNVGVRCHRPQFLDHRHRRLFYPRRQYRLLRQSDHQHHHRRVPADFRL